MNAVSEAIKPQICMLASSSRGNSACVRYGEHTILIDAGISAKRIKDSLADIGCPIGTLNAIFITHEHTDHICGLEVLMKKLDLPVYVPSGCLNELLYSCPSASRNLVPITDGQSIEVGGMTVTPYKTPHDSLDSVGYRVQFPSGECLGYATDIGHITKNVVAILDGCQYVVVESNHDLPRLMSGAYPDSLKRRISGNGGHLANQGITKMLPYLVKNGARHIMLAHLSEENNTPELAYASAKSALAEYGYTVIENGEGDVDLCVAAPRNIVCI